MSQAAPGGSGAAVGAIVAGYRLQRLLGRGTSASVFLARDPHDAQEVALKLIELPAGDRAHEARRAFLQGSQAAQRLVHPHIVPVHAAGIDGPLAWLAMQAVPGGDLAAHTRPPQLLPAAEALDTGAALAAALGHAHRLGVVHRDLKPANVLLHRPAGLVKLADFGLARLMDAEQTATGLLLGTPQYMAPEQLAGNPPSAQTDLYALGVLLFELLCGRLPHQAASLGLLMQRIANEDAPELRLLRPELPPALGALLARLLAKRPGQRPGQGAEVAEELLALARTLPR